MSGNIIQSYRNNVYTEFNSEARPWRFYASNIYHDPSLVTDISYLTGTSVYDAYRNTLNIEASGSNINFYTNDNYKTYFYGDVCVDKDLSLNSKLDVGGVVSALRFVGDGTSLTGTGSLALQENKDCSFGFVEISNMVVFGDVSFNGFIDFSENLYVNGDVSFQRNLDVSGILFATKLLGDGSELAGVGQLALRQVLDGSLGFVEISNLMVNIDTSLNGHVDISENLFVGGSISINKNLNIDGILTDGNYTFDTSGNVTGLGTVGCSDISSTGNLAVAGTITLDSITITREELGVLDGVTQGTALSSKALILDSNKDITGLRNMTATGHIRSGYDTDTTSYLGRAALGYVGDSAKTDFASFSHVDKVSSIDYALLQGSDGTTFLNSSAGKNLHLRIGDVTQFFIESTNKIGIGTTNSQQITEKLSINGKVAALGYENFSDSRIKFDKKNIENGLNILKNLTPKLYNKLDDFDNSLNLRKEIGFIAQEVLMIDDISFVVKVRENDGLYTLDYGSIFAINVAATKELDSLVRNLRGEVDLLKNENKMMKDVLNKLLLNAGENTI
jgi:cytoskeletal protein CcmA (bactofilin family)